MASLHFSLFTFHFFFHNQPAAWAFGSLGFRFAGGGGRWRAGMASGGEGFSTERARLAGDGLSTERARLAQGGYRGQGFGTERARPEAYKLHFFAKNPKNPPETHWNHKCGFPVKLIGIVENPAVFF